MRSKQKSVIRVLRGQTEGESEKELSGLGPTVLGHQPTGELGAEAGEKFLEAETDKSVDSQESQKEKGSGETLLGCKASV